MEQVKIKKSVKRRLKKQEEKIAASKGAVKARFNHIPTSTRKMRLVADLIRGKRINEASAILEFQTKHAAINLKKLLYRAISDWQQKNPDINIDTADLYVKTIYVDGGPILKRMRPAPQGRGYKIRKRSNHITIVIDSHILPEQLNKKQEAVEEEVKETKDNKKASAQKEKTADESKTKKTKKAAK
jgi:large subunit ribosomal protein L22